MTILKATEEAIIQAIGNKSLNNPLRLSVSIVIINNIKKIFYLEFPALCKYIPFYDTFVLKFDANWVPIKHTLNLTNNDLPPCPTNSL